MKFKVGDKVILRPEYNPIDCYGSLINFEIEKIEIGYYYRGKYNIYYMKDVHSSINGFYEYELKLDVINEIKKIKTEKK